MSGKLTVSRVRAIMVEVLFKREEVIDGKPPDGALLIEGVAATFGIHPERVSEKKQEIAELLAELPEQFFEDTGGGWSFVNACATKDGEQWADLHRDMDSLFVLGIAVGLVKLLLPRDMWSALPLGMPYYVVLSETRQLAQAQPN